MNLKQIKKQLKIEKENYYDDDCIKRIFHIITKHPNIKYYKIMKDAKIYQYYKKNHKNLIEKFKLLYYGIKTNRNATKYGIELYGEFGNNLKISHGCIIVNGKATIGDSCVLHGMNCIGNNGKSLEAPKIGNNVDIGVGAILIGDITIADGIKIGANAVVTKSFLEKNITIAGVPARKV